MAKSSRSAPVRRSPRAARPTAARAARTPLVPERPVAAVCAAVFGVLVTAEVLYLTWLLVAPDADLVAVPRWLALVLVAVALVPLAGAVLTVLGRGRGWVVLLVGCVVPLLGLLGVAVLFGSLGAGSATWWALLLALGPLGGLVLAAQRPVRGWTAR
ncbi:hypothetical protein [Klenkia taihuensis]|uniref:Uncharacterized protein n=1 Tax=Klenkia taihuensis TaxID=1225127 RepID=A0A1I1T3V1_9ACTN|nr:hypothetical protein [Klenkia taihuensis]SFD53272.1 hypothetical protein SAMN05661030_3644 [Klenkia taihuensis]